MQRILPIILSLGIFTILAIGYLHPVTAFTQDLGRHILTGKIIIATLSVPKTNLLSYTAPTFPFINHHWFSEVLFYLQQQAFGVIGLQLISVFIAAMAFGLVYFFALKKATPAAVIIVALLYLRILLERTDIRPELYSFLFLSIFATLLYYYRERFTRLIYLLIPLELLWVNTHIYFFVGLTIFALFILDELWARRKNLKQKHTLTLLSVFAATCLITLCNPNGLSGAAYPLHVFQNYGYAIEENQTLFFLENYGLDRPAFLYFKMSVLLLFLSLAISYKKTRPIDWLLALVFTYAGVMAVRNFPLFVFATFVPACIALSNTASLLFSKQIFAKRIASFLPFALCAVIIWQISIIANHKPVGLGIAKGAERGADFFLTNKLSGPIFNNFDIGSYIAYRMYPKERVFIDGRPEAYPSTFIQGVYIPIQQDPKLFSEATKKYGFNAIFFSHTDMTPWANVFLAEVLKSPNWLPVYLDDTVIILLQMNDKNEALLKKYGMTPKTLRAKNLDQKDLNSLLKIASFYNKVGLADQELASYQQILQAEPNYCPALYNTAVVLSNKNNPTSAIYAARYQQQCAN